MKRECVLVDTETVEGVVLVQASFFLFVGGGSSGGEDESGLGGG